MTNQLEPLTEPGQITWASSDEDGGPDVGITVGLGNDRFLWCGEITKSRWEDLAGQAASMWGEYGWWLILYGREQPLVLGKLLDNESAHVLTQILSEALSREQKP